MPIHKIIKSYRTAKGLTQEHIADKMNMTAQTYARWENGKTKMTDEKLELFAKAVGKTVKEIREAISEDGAIHLLQDNNDSNFSNLSIINNNYYGDKEIILENESLKNLLSEKDKLILEKEKIILAKDEQIELLKKLIENLKTKK